MKSISNSMSYEISLLVFCRHSFGVRSFQLFVTVKMARILGFLKTNKQKNNKQKRKEKQPRYSSSHKNPGTETLRKRPSTVRITFKSSE